MIKVFIAGWRLWLVAVCIILSFCCVFGRLYFLHVFEQEELSKIVERTRKNLEVERARRGNIVDARGNILATTRPVIEVGVDPQATLEEDEEKLPELARLLGLPLPTLKARFEQKTRRGDGRYDKEVILVRWRKLANGIDESTYEKILELGVAGVYGNRKYERNYPNNRLASHLIGFVNKEDTPTLGIENYMDYYLRGQDGWKEKERDGRRREMVQFRSREVAPRDGFNVELTIDLVIQNFIEQELKKLVEQYNPKCATIIVSEPATGYLLGLANYPDFDLNEFWKYPIETHKNRAVTDVYEPGSVFKIVGGSGALNEGLVRRETVFDCSVRAVEYNGRARRLPKDHKPYKELSFEETIVKSSNRAAAQVGMRLGASRLYDYTRKFGFGEFTELGIGAESRGQLAPVKKWDGLTITRLPIGHSISATPLQVHYAMSVIACQGILMRPIVVRRVFDNDRESVVEFRPHAKRRVVRADVAREMGSMLVKTVGVKGTAARAEIPLFEVAGKTGTTQKIIDGQYSHKHHVASFSGFFPASDPRVVITVVVDDPQLKGYAYGGVVAAPSFKNIGEKLITYLAIQPKEEDVDLLARHERARRTSKANYTQGYQ